MRRVDVACIGTLVADIFSSVLSKLPKPGQLMWVDDISLSVGGCASNTAISLSKLGIRSGVIGKVGNDPFGNFIINCLKQRQVDTSIISQSATKDTSKTIVLLTINEDRRFIHTYGANADFRVGDIDFNYISQVKVLYVGGYLDLPNLTQSSLIKLLEFAKERGIITFLDVAIAHPYPDLINECKDAFAYVDYFSPNQNEAKILTEKGNPQLQAEVFLQYNPEMTVLITMGKDGTLARTNRQIINFKSYKVKTVDPSGGGDAFDAGFILGILENWELEKTLKFANAVGASAVTSMGCTTGVFNRTQALQFIEDNKLNMEVIEKPL